MPAAVCPSAFDDANGFGHGSSAMLGRCGGGGSVEALGFGNHRRFVERQQIRIGRGGSGQREGLLHGAANRIGIEAIGGGARGSLIERHANRKPAILLGDVLMNGVVGEARERAEMRAEERLDIRNTRATLAACCTAPKSSLAFASAIRSQRPG